MSSLSLKDAISVVHASTEVTHKFVPGMIIGSAGPLRHVHYTNPVWENADYFQGIDLEPEYVVQAVKNCSPGSHIIGVISCNTDGRDDEFLALGYQRIGGNFAEAVMVRRLLQTDERHYNLYPVQQAGSEAERRHVMLAMEDEGHWPITEVETADPQIRYYFIDQDGQCVCRAKAIASHASAANIGADSYIVGICVEPLWTHPDYRRRGIATTLMKQIHADGFANGATHCVILASPTGQLLYETLGYTIAGYHMLFKPLAHA